METTTCELFKHVELPKTSSEVELMETIEWDPLIKKEAIPPKTSSEVELMETMLPGVTVPPD